jgi:hypothetical protein
MPNVVEFRDLRADWLANGNFMARALQRQLRSREALLIFQGLLPCPQRIEKIKRRNIPAYCDSKGQSVAREFL